LLLIVELSLLVIDVKRNLMHVVFCLFLCRMVCAKKGLVQKEGDNASSFEFKNTDSSVEKVATPILYYLCLVKQKILVRTTSSPQRPHSPPLIHQGSSLRLNQSTRDSKSSRYLYVAAQLGHFVR
jgi:hypothetical protein